MAVFFDGAQTFLWSGAAVYGRLSGDVSRSGNVVTLSNLVLDIWSSVSVWGTDTLAFTVNGTPTSFGVTASGTSLGSHALNNTSISVGASDTSATIGWSSSDSYSGSFAISFPSGATAPTGLAASNIVAGTTSVTSTVSVESWGTGGSSDPSAYYRELQIWTYSDSGLVLPRRFQTILGQTLSGEITVDNNSSGDLTIVPNTRYVLGIYASNGNANTDSVRIGAVATTAEAPTVAFVSATGNTANFTYATTADGGFYDKNLQYSLDGGTTWVTFATVTGGAATSGTFTISGLSGGSHTLKIRSSTGAGTTLGTDIEFETVGMNGIAPNGARLVGGLCSVAGVAVNITGTLVSKDGVATKS